MNLNLLEESLDIQIQSAYKNMEQDNYPAKPFRCANHEYNRIFKNE